MFSGVMRFRISFGYKVTAEGAVSKSCVAVKAGFGISPVGLSGRGDVADGVTTAVVGLFYEWRSIVACTIHGAEDLIGLGGIRSSFCQEGGCWSDCRVPAGRSAATDEHRSVDVTIAGSKAYGVANRRGQPTVGFTVSDMGTVATENHKVSFHYPQMLQTLHVFFEGYGCENQGRAGGSDRVTPRNVPL
ncbi:hypothetical protein NE237_025414 [Protea cynaroides]|uniref:Uncharacterized protein n=1 Tax=Protea cynaroides TaxID=273540 RepID=A0A9Q0H2B9_9MAGN|nr:hypothetical protein NE237_025414 [Protea cynaroides]